MRFSDWIKQLELDVIQGEYGYESGEFTVYPELWRPSFIEGLSPSQAFAKALEAFGDARADEDRRKAENWERIQEEDRISVERWRTTHQHS